MKNNSKTNRYVEVNEVIYKGITSVVERKSDGIWVGTMSELTGALNRVLSKRQRTLLPASPSALRLAVNRVVSRIRNKGISVKFGRTTDHTRTRFVRFAQ